ncbi:MAG: hypothetical protein C0582_02625 [Alphaproteobacteria bacterium]|nr:MAG: hypothetical protein C0582_02625 [Alphaproteobacteria bacterium]
MSNQPKSKTLFHFITIRIVVPLVLFLAAVIAVYYFAFYQNRHEDQQTMNSEATELLNDASLAQSGEEPSHPQLLPKQENQPIYNTEKATVYKESEQLPQAHPDKSAMREKEHDLKLCILFSDFIVRARTGLSYESALFHLHEALRDERLKDQLKRLSPYAEQGIGVWSVILTDLDKIVDKGVHSRARQSDPWIIKFIKSFVHVRKKSELTPLLKEAIAQHDWPEAYRLTDELIDQGFKLRRWRRRLKNYVQGHVLLNSFFLTYQSSSLYSQSLNAHSDPEGGK